MFTKTESELICCGAFISNGNIGLNRDKGKITGISFVLKQTDKRFLDFIKNTFEVGNISGPYKTGSENSDPIWRYKCSNIIDILKIVNSIWKYLPNFRKNDFFIVLSEYFNSERIKKIDLTQQKWFNFKISDETFDTITSEESFFLCGGILSLNGSWTYHTQKENPLIGNLRLNISCKEIFYLNFLNSQIENSGNIRNIQNLNVLSINIFEKIDFLTTYFWEILSENKKEIYNELKTKYQECLKHKKLGVSDINSLKTHCDYGHEFNSENTHISTVGSRVCRICSRKRNADSKLKKANTNGF